MKLSAKEKVILVLKYIALGLFTILCLYPLVWLFLSSFKILNYIPIRGDFQKALALQTMYRQLQKVIFCSILETLLLLQYQQY